MQQLNVECSFFEAKIESSNFFFSPFNHKQNEIFARNDCIHWYGVNAASIDKFIGWCRPIWSMHERKIRFPFFGTNNNIYLSSVYWMEAIDWKKNQMKQNVICIKTCRKKWFAFVCFPISIPFQFRTYFITYYYAKVED